MVLIALQNKSKQIIEENLEKVNSLKIDLANFEEFGINEEEFKKFFKSQPVYSLAQLGEYSYDYSKILSYTRFKEILSKIETEGPIINLVKCLLRLDAENLS